MRDDDDDSGSSTEAEEDAPNEAAEIKDELGLLISAWLFDPEVAAHFEAQRFGDALGKAGVAANPQLVDALRAIDPEQIRALVETFRRPFGRPMS